MTRIVTGLESSGLAERETDPKDARRVRIRATPKGIRLLQKGRERRIKYLARQLASLSEKELAALGETVATIEQVLREWS